ncbi:MAG: divalent-cation tolerance protein CutA [Ferrimonas sp.]
MSTVLVVLCTCPSLSSAEQLANVLLEQRLAACINLLDGVQSWYHWKGKICRDQEVQLIIKTQAQHWPALEEAIITHHPYELPEILALPITAGYAPYLAWIQRQTTECTTP